MPESTADSKIMSDGNAHQPLTAENFTDAGDIKGTPGDPKGLSSDLALVVGTAQAARDFLLQKQWNLLWR
jgi:hypothetical protein